MFVPENQNILLEKWMAHRIWVGCSPSGPPGSYAYGLVYTSLVLLIFVLRLGEREQLLEKSVHTHEMILY